MTTIEHTDTNIKQSNSLQIKQHNNQSVQYPTIQELKEQYGLDFSPKHYAFLIEYVKNGYNGTQAYQQIRPTASIGTANTESCKLLKKPQFTNAVQVLINCSSALTTRKEDVTRDMLRIQQRAETKDQLNVALNAVVERAKLHRLYDNDEADEKKYAKFLSAIQINVNVGDNLKNQGGNEAKTIEVVPLSDSAKSGQEESNGNNEL